MVTCKFRIEPHVCTSRKQMAWALLTLLTTCFLVSQFFGLIHSIYHPSPLGLIHQTNQPFNAQVTPTKPLTGSHTPSSAAFLDSHFGYVGSQVCSSQQCENESTPSCNLFESLMLGVCLGSSIYVLLLLKNAFCINPPLSIYCALLTAHCNYQSRAPPTLG